MTNYENIICDANNLYKAYLKTVKNSKWKETTQKFSINYLRKIFRLIELLEKKEYKTDETGEFTLNERGSIRRITTLQPSDRLVRHVLCDEILTPKIEKKVIHDNGACITGKGVSFSRKRFETHMHRAYMEYGTNDIYGLFGDFRKFYDNILHEVAKEKILSLFEYDEYLDWLLTVIFENFEVDVSYMTDSEFEKCLTEVFNKMEYIEIPKELRQGQKMMKKSVNIGDQFSQILGLYYPNDIDFYVKTKRRFKHYGRHMDDFYVFHNSKEELHILLNEITEIGKSLGIHINEKKTRIEKLSGVNMFLQTKYTLLDTGKIEKRVNPKRVTSMRQKIKKLSKKENVPYERIEDMFKSWMGSYYKILSREQRKGLIELYEETYHKKIRFEKRGSKTKMIIEEKE